MSIPYVYPSLQAAGAQDAAQVFTAIRRWKDGPGVQVTESSDRNVSTLGGCRCRFLLVEELEAKKEKLDPIQEEMMGFEC